MATAIRFITRIQDTDDYGDAHTWAGAHTFNAGISIGAGQGITMADDDWIGIGAAAERIIFDAAGDISFMGASVGIGTQTPSWDVHLKHDQNNLTGMWVENATNGTASRAAIAVETAGGSLFALEACAPLFSTVADWADASVFYSEQSEIQIINIDSSGCIRFKTRGYTAAHERVRIDNVGNVGIGVTTMAGLLHVDQASTTGAKPVLVLDQADVDYVLMKVIGTAQAASADRTLVADSDFGTPGALVGWIQIEIQDDGNRISDGDYYVPFYAVPT